MSVPVMDGLVLSRKSDYVETVAEQDTDGVPVPWPEGTQVWFEFSNGGRWDGVIDAPMGRAVFSIDKEDVDLIPQNTRYWVYIHKPDDAHGVDMLLRYGTVDRRG